MKNSYLYATDFYEEASTRLASLLQAKERLTANKKNHPEGKIRMSKHGKGMQFFIRKEQSEKNGVYLSKKEKKDIHLYVQKWYDLKALVMIDQEIESLKKVLLRSNLGDKIRRLYSDANYEVKEYVNPVDISDEEYIKKWLDIKYDPLKYADDIPVFITDHGERVRSKSELAIANLLAKEGIPYKYECPLRLRNGVIVHPDFTILCVKHRKIVYWEHRGMMDDVQYARHAVRKIKDYSDNGIYIGDTLFITEETQQNPLGTSEIKAVIHQIMR